MSVGLSVAPGDSSASLSKIRTDLVDYEIDMSSVDLALRYDIFSPSKAIWEFLYSCFTGEISAFRG